MGRSCGITPKTPPQMETPRSSIEEAGTGPKPLGPASSQPDPWETTTVVDALSLFPSECQPTAEKKSKSVFFLPPEQGTQQAQALCPDIPHNERTALKKLRSLAALAETVTYTTGAFENHKSWLSI